MISQIQDHTGLIVKNATAVSGGCISNTARLDFTSDERFFLKWSPTSEHPAAMFAEEARSLSAIAQTHTVRVPGVVANHTADGYAWLLLEWLEPGARTSRSQAQLGEQLAALHRHTAERYGWFADNFIGSLPQSNQQRERWSDFWRTQRLDPQLSRACGNFSAADNRRLEKLANNTAELLGDVESEGPSLLHGDLWGGNLHIMADGTPAIIDPASYYGHREVDLAMSRLFGGFSEDFYRAYQGAWPSVRGLEKRLLLYQLYYLLVHVNLFGGGYASQTMSVAAQLGF